MRRVCSLELESLIESALEKAVDGVAQPRHVEERSRSILADQQILSLAGRSRFEDRAHGYFDGFRFRRSASELLLGQALLTQLRDGGEVRHLALVFAVIVDERCHRPRVLLRIAPSPFLANSHHPADHAPYQRWVVGVPRETSESDRGRSDVRIPEVEKIRIAELLDMRLAALRKDRVLDSPFQFRRSCALFTFCFQRVPEE